MIILYEKRREAPETEFKPTTYKRLAWLIDHIANVEANTLEADVRINALLSGTMINTDLHSFALSEK